MDDQLARRFEENRPRLTAAAQRMLGSSAEAQDAVQEAWLRLERSDADAVENLPAWLTTVVARVCLNLLRQRRTHDEQPLDEQRLDEGLREGRLEDSRGTPMSAADPEQYAELADSVGLALLVVLDALSPPERLAFVLHDVFDLPFDEIAGVVGKSPAATRQLASRARRRVRGAAVPERDRGRQRRVVEAYLAATRSGDFAALLAVLHPDVVLRADAAASPGGRPIALRGATSVAQGAMASSGRARHAVPAIVDGDVGLVMTPGGHPAVALRFTVVDDQILEIDVVADPSRLDELIITSLA